MIADDLGLSEKYIFSLASCATAYYKTFYVGGRRIDAPASELKLVQCWISDFVRAETDRLPDNVTAYEHGASIVNNALIHAKHAHFLTLDIRHFFRSCGFEKVKLLFLAMSIDCRRGSECGRLEEEDADLLAKLSCCEGALSIGSPSSPALANRIMIPVDKEIAAVIPRECSYSRYSDDITISSNDWIDAERMSSDIGNVLGRHGFELHPRKIHCRGKGSARKVTGVYVTEEGSLSIGKSRKRRLGLDLYQVLVKQSGSPEVVLGELAFCKQVEPEFLNGLLSKYANYGLARKYGGVYPALKSLMGHEKYLENK